MARSVARSQVAEAEVALPSEVALSVVAEAEAALPEAVELPLVQPETPSTPAYLAGNQPVLHHRNQTFAEVVPLPAAEAVLVAMAAASEVEAVAALPAALPASGHTTALLSAVLPEVVALVALDEALELEELLQVEPETLSSLLNQPDIHSRHLPLRNQTFAVFVQPELQAVV